jgi:hypothetical protein
MADQLNPSVPNLAALVDAAEADVLAFMSFPKDHPPKTHSVNPPELARIGTNHACCGNLHERPIEAGLDPFEGAAEGQAKDLMD